MRAVTVTQKQGEEVPTEVMADAIIAISQGIKKLRSGKLKDNALYLLIQHAAPSQTSRGGFSTGRPISIKTIKAVIEGLESLQRTFVK